MGTRQGFTVEKCGEISARPTSGAFVSVRRTTIMTQAGEKAEQLYSISMFIPRIPD